MVDYQAVAKELKDMLKAIPASTSETDIKDKVDQILKAKGATSPADKTEIGKAWNAMRAQANKDARATAMTTGATVTGACYYWKGGTVNCDQMTEAECAAIGGSFVAGEACDPATPTVYKVLEAEGILKLERPAGS